MTEQNDTPINNQSSEQPVNPYAAMNASSGPIESAEPMQAEPVQVEPANPYAAAAATNASASAPANPYAKANAPASRPANPYGAVPPQPYATSGQPVQPASPYAAQPGQPASPYAGQPASPYAGQPYPGSVVAGSPSTGKATGALVCGILAILFSGTVVLSAILGIVAIVMAGSFIKEGGVSGTAKAGRICGIVGIVFSILSLVAYIALFAIGMSVIDEYETSSSLNSSIAAKNGEVQIEGLSITVPEGMYDEVELGAIKAAASDFEKIKNQDEAMMQTIGALADAGFQKQFDFSMADCGIDPVEYARAMAEGFDYEINLAAATEKSGGFVSFSIDCRDVIDVLTVFDSDLDTLFSFSSELSSMTEEEAKLRVGELFMEAVSEAGMTYGDYCNIDVEFVNGEWVVDQDDVDEEIDWLFGLADAD